jgi:hypothetical protein
MKKLLTIIFLILINLKSFSQTKVEGIYALKGVHDMAAAFNFTADGKFEFEYYYGASDRTAAGTFFIAGDTLKLKSNKEAGKDFSVTKQSKKGNGYTIIVKDKNPILINQVRVIFVKADSARYMDVTGNTGKLETEKIDIDKIYLMHPFFPDIATLIKDENNSNTYFEVTLNPSAQQVSFSGIDFFIKDSTLTCLPNYFLPFENIKFERQ